MAQPFLWMLIIITILTGINATSIEANPAWEIIAIGGGGYVLQTHFHPRTGHCYMRTDVGGIYLRS